MRILKLSLLGLFSTLILGVSSAHAAPANGGPLGLGIVLGDPSAITAKYNVNEVTGYDFGLAFDVNKWVLVYADWLNHFPGAFNTDVGFINQLVPYVGVGVVAVISNGTDVETRRYKYFDDKGSDSFALGVRIPLGIEWRIPTAPIGIFLELAPGLTVLPATDGFVQAGIGARFFF